MNQTITIRDALLDKDTLIVKATHWRYIEGEGLDSQLIATGCKRYEINLNCSNNTTYKVTFRAFSKKWEVAKSEAILHECTHNKVLPWDWPFVQDFSILIVSTCPEGALRQGRTKIEKYMKEHNIKLKAALPKPKVSINRDLIIRKSNNAIAKQRLQ